MARCASSAPRISGTTELLILRFRDASGKPVSASWRIDDGSWQEGKRVHVRGPADHSNDGVHTVEARPLGGGDVAASVKVGIDTKPPEVTAAQVSPDRTDGSGTVKLSFTAPAEDGVTVDWAVVDVLDIAGRREGRLRPRRPERCPSPGRYPR